MFSRRGPDFMEMKQLRAVGARWTEGEGGVIATECKSRLNNKRGHRVIPRNGNTFSPRYYTPRYNYYNLQSKIPTIIPSPFDEANLRLVIDQCAVQCVLRELKRARPLLFRYPVSKR